MWFNGEQTWCKSTKWKSLESVSVMWIVKYADDIISTVLETWSIQMVNKEGRKPGLA